MKDECTRLPVVHSEMCCAQSLQGRSLFSDYHMGSSYVGECNWIYAHKKSLAFSVQSAMTLATEPHNVQVPDNECQLIQNIYVKKYR